jgi:hypothetical protein
LPAPKNADTARKRDSFPPCGFTAISPGEVLAERLNYRWPVGLVFNQNVVGSRKLRTQRANGCRGRGEIEPRFQTIKQVILASFRTPYMQSHEITGRGRFRVEE